MKGNIKLALSMTGYGHGTRTTPEYTVTIDLKSVNHRYLEIYFKIPKLYSFLEDKLRYEISNRVSRGKLEVLISIERIILEEARVELNKPIVTSYLKAIQEMRNEFQLDGTIDLQSIVTLPEVFKSAQPEADQDLLAGITLMAMEDALTALIEMRRNEGNSLIQGIKTKLTLLEEMRLNLLKLAPVVVITYQEKLAKRIQELVGEIEIDPARLATEVAIFADKSDITEELVRIESHLHQFLKTTNLTEPVGRRLDFIIQELNREINTVGSKANDLRIAQTVIEFKAELEKVREQIQNIE
jgi:uncharacterized protein (TIGR00255 family)